MMLLKQSPPNNEDFVPIDDKNFRLKLAKKGIMPMYVWQDAFLYKITPELLGEIVRKEVKDDKEKI